MDSALEKKLTSYYLTAIFGVVFALVGFSYNAWRLEATEDNSNIRMAAFEVLTELAELEQVIYAAHYDKNIVTGSPRKGWVKVGLIADLSMLISPPVETKAVKLKAFWAQNWERVAEEREVTDQLVAKLDGVRSEIKKVLSELK